MHRLKTQTKTLLAMYTKSSIVFFSKALAMYYVCKKWYSELYFAKAYCTYFCASFMLISVSFHDSLDVNHHLHNCMLSKFLAKKQLQWINCQPMYSLPEEWHSRVICCMSFAITPNPFLYCIGLAARWSFCFALVSLQCYACLPSCTVL